MWIRELPSGRWQACYRDPAGNIRTRSFGPREKTAARRWAQDQETDVRRGLHFDPSRGKIALAKFWPHFLKTGSLRPSTRARYETHSRLYIVPSLGGRSLASIARADVAGLLADLGESKGAATVESVRRILHRVFEVAVVEDRIARNPVHGLRVPAPERRAPRYLSAEEVARIAEETPERHRALVYFLAYSGLRIGEASALRVRNLDLEAGVVRVVESAPEVAGYKLAGQPTKSRKARAVHLGPRLVALLRAHLLAHGSPLDPASLVFAAGRHGEPVRQNNFRKRVFQKAAERAGITPIPTVHDLRHTAASLMARAGYSMREAQEQLGHSHATMTDRYTHLFPDDRAARVQRLDELMVTEVAPTVLVALS